MGGKQADRKAKKTNAKEEEQEVVGEGEASGKLVGKVKSLMMGSCLVEVMPKLQALLTGKDVPATGIAKEESTEGEVKDGDDAAKPEAEVSTPESIFESLQKRLVWHNSLGLAEPTTAEDSIAGWLAIKGMEFDGGPRSRKKGSPALDRISTNLLNNMPQYMHIVLALMILRAFLFRSFFACLPWLVGYQVASLMLPLEQLRDKVLELTKKPCPPQIEGQIPIKFRVAGTMAIHCLVWLFFIFELLWKTSFLEKIPLMALVAGHAYVLRNVEP